MSNGDNGVDMQWCVTLNVSSGDGVDSRDDIENERKLCVTLSVTSGECHKNMW